MNFFDNSKTNCCESNTEPVYAGNCDYNRDQEKYEHTTVEAMPKMSTEGKSEDIPVDKTSADTELDVLQHSVGDNVMKRGSNDEIEINSELANNAGPHTG